MVGQGALDRRRPAWAARAACALALALLLALARQWQLVRCPWAALLGLPCPGCGLTRAAGLLLRGDLRGAVQLHPLSPLLVPIVVLALVGAIWEPWWQAHASQARWRRSHWVERSLGPAAWALLLLVIGVWLARFWGAFGGPVPI
jgi:hypothetical protein